MTVYFVTRHEGARFWINYMSRQGRLPEPVDKIVEHLDLDMLRKGDLVMGTLPIGMAAELRRRGCRYRSLDLRVPAEFRGKELTATQMAAYGATLTEYRITEIDRIDFAPSRIKAPKTLRPPMLVTIVSDQVVPQLIGLASVEAAEVLLLVTPSMARQGKVAGKLMGQHLLPDGGHPKVHVRQLVEGTYAELLAQAERVLDEQLAKPRECLYLNLTGGTKLMSQAFAQAALGRTSVKPFYVDTSAKRIETLDASGDSRPMQAVANVRTLLEASGLDASAAANGSEVLEAQLQRRRLITSMLAPDQAALLPSWNQLVYEVETLIKEFDGTLSNKGRQNFYPRMIDREVDPRGGLFVLHPKEPLRKALGRTLGKQLVSAGVLHEIPTVGYKAPLPLRFTHPNELAFMKGGWLEVHVANLLQDAHVDDWALGVEVRGEGLNELDLVAASGNRLLFIEVKTSRQARHDGGERSKEAEQALYKLSAVSSQLSRLFEERWYVSSQPLAAADLKRAAHLGIRVFCGGPIPVEAPDAQPLERLGDALKDWARRNRLERAACLQPSAWPKLSSNWEKARKASAYV